MDGQQALDKVKENVLANGNKKCSYDLILMDCNMPQMDGYESTHEIRSYLYSLNLDQPIIVAVTGHTEPAYVDRAIKSGMNQVLSKPI
jgi:CheY-like chemotaxis protein